MQTAWRGIPTGNQAGVPSTNVVQTTGRGNVNRRVGCAPSKDVLSIWIERENDRIPVDAGFEAKLRLWLRRI